MKTVVELQIKIHYVLHPVKILCNGEEVLQPTPKTEKGEKAQSALVLATLGAVGAIIDKFKSLQGTHCTNLSDLQKSHLSSLFSELLDWKRYPKDESNLKTYLEAKYVVVLTYMKTNCKDTIHKAIKDDLASFSWAAVLASSQESFIYFIHFKM